jgi:L-ascorbate metabolism protein UlaG (beta-lactamase superfamily)
LPRLDAVLLSHLHGDHFDGVARDRLPLTGDTLMRPVLSEIPQRYGDIDAMIIHLGGTRLAGLLLTMDGRQGAELTNLIKPAMAIPVHDDDYSVFTSPLTDRAEGSGVTAVHPIVRGDTLQLPDRAR